MRDDSEPSDAQFDRGDVAAPSRASTALLRLASLAAAPGLGLVVPADARQPVVDVKASLQFVRDVAERVRECRDRSSVMAGEARQVAHNAIVAMWEAEERALKAEAATAAALARAEEAEAQLRQLRSQLDADKPAPTGIDRWLNEAYQQLRLAGEKRDGQMVP